jgi:hypothetical protein
MSRSENISELPPRYPSLTIAWWILKVAGSLVALQVGVAFSIIAICQYSGFEGFQYAAGDISVGSILMFFIGLYVGTANDRYTHIMHSYMDCGDTLQGTRDVLEGMPENKKEDVATEINTIRNWAKNLHATDSEHREEDRYANEGRKNALKRCQELAGEKEAASDRVQDLSNNINTLRAAHHYGMSPPIRTMIIILLFVYFGIISPLKEPEYHAGVGIALDCLVANLLFVAGWWSAHKLDADGTTEHYVIRSLFLK